MCASMEVKMYETKSLNLIDTVYYMIWQTVYTIECPLYYTG